MGKVRRGGGEPRSARRAFSRKPRSTTAVCDRNFDRSRRFQPQEQPSAGADTVMSAVRVQVPQQHNGYDCGFYLVMFVNKLAANLGALNKLWSEPKWMAHAELKFTSAEIDPCAPTRSQWSVTPLRRSSCSHPPRRRCIG